jgi:molybdopterin synthase sulfur carrier subunit
MDIQVYATLRDVVGGKTICQAVAAPMTLGRLLDLVFTQHPGLRGKILDADGNLQSAIHVLVNGREARHLDGLLTPVSPEDSVRILPPVGGGVPTYTGTDS